MRKFLILTLFFSFITVSSAQTRAQLDSAISILSLKINYLDPYSFEQSAYAELAYLKRTYKLDMLKINDTIYKSKLNDYYYKRFFPFSKFLDDEAVVTEDCLTDAVNGPVHQSRKLLFYVIYPQSIKLPENIVSQLEEYSSIDEFFGPYNMLNIIYYLKKYNYNNLTKTQKDKLATTESFLSKLLYTKYVSGKPWSFHKFLAVKVLKMNKSEFATGIDFSDLVRYINANGALQLGDEDMKDMELIKRVGGKEMMQMEANAVLWIFLS
jgi:hypothetical protein